jgi:Na+/proline symporter
MAIGVVLVAVLGVDLPVALLIGLGVLAFYSIAGGIMAGVYTDLFQGALMIVASLAVFSYAIDSAGGLDQIGATLWRMDTSFLGPWGTRGPMLSLSWFVLFLIGGVGQPHGITKFMMLKNIGNLKWVGLLTGPCYALLSLLWVSIGLSMRTLVERGVQTPLDSPDLAAPVFLLNYVPEWLAGVVFAALIAAIMSTADSFLNLGAASVVRDIPTALLGRPLRRELFWSRIATGVILIASAVFALYMENLIALLGTFGWGTFAAAIFPSIAIGLNWKRANAAACVASIGISILLNFALELSAKYGLYQLPYGMNVGCFSLLASLIVFIGVSWFSSAEGGRDLPTDVNAAMDM